MPAANAKVARLFSDLADALEMNAANPFRVRAYRNAARMLETLDRDVAGMVQKGEDLRQLPGIGEDLAKKVEEAVQTGTLAMLERERAALPPGARQLLGVPGLGPKRVKRLVEDIGVKDMAGLRKAAKEGRIKGMRGFGASLEKRLADEDAALPSAVRTRWVDAVQPAQRVVDALSRVRGIVHIQVAGSLRRLRDTVGDIDIVAAAVEPAAVTARLAAHPGVERVLVQGPTRCTVLLPSGQQVDLRVVPPEAFGAALVHFTGSKEHNVLLRERARERGWLLNEYGLWDGTTRLAGATEEEVYDALGLAWVPPELREGRDEVQLAADGSLPRLVQESDLVGDFHVHTDASDGAHTLRQMLDAAVQRGLKYVAITEHTPRTAIARGLSVPTLLKRLDEIDEVQKEYPGLRILKGAEVDILPGGRLDYEDEVLRRLDLAVCSLHHRGKMTGAEATDAMIEAMRRPRAAILGHPTGRRINRRDALDLDFDRLLDAARDGGWAVEANGQPERLDLWGEVLRMARERKVPVAADSDAHSVREMMEFPGYAVAQCRRGGLEAKHVLNARSPRRLERFLDSLG